jgi:tRNA(fMet)-specific endonuclease VapC
VTEYLLDTNHLSYLQQKDSYVVDHLYSLLPGDRLLTCTINVGELLGGALLLPEGSRQRNLLAQCYEVIARMDEILPVDLAAAEKYAEIDAALRHKGRPLPVNDVWIAAVTVVRGATLVTNDAHFAYVDGLITENWTR